MTMATLRRRVSVTHPRLSVADLNDGLVLPEVPDDASGGEGGGHDVLHL